jgi:DMSO/TMAO reductase YedYZ molybdopterin-dependent catalytic subunit
MRLAPRPVTLSHVTPTTGSPVRITDSETPDQLDLAQIVPGDAGGVPKRAASWAGAIGAASALAVAELWAGLTASVPPLTTSVGQLFIPFTPGWLKQVAIALFGTADKPVFVVGVVIVSLALGAWAGRRARTSFVAPLALFGGLGLFGGIASLDQPGASAGVVALSTLSAVVVGIATLSWLLRLARTGAEPADAAVEAATAGVTLGRRPLLVGGSFAVVGAASAALLGNTLRRARIQSVISSTEITLPPALAGAIDGVPALTPANSLAVDGITPLVVPNDDFYRIDTAIGTPLVDAATWSMTIGGMVDNPITFTYDDLLAEEVVERYVTLMCVSNEVGAGLVGNALWRGVLLGPLLERAGVQPGAGQVVGRSIDGWAGGFPLEAAFDRDAMIAFAMNGEPLPAAHGFPARLVVPGVYGYVSATKWLAEIEITTWEGFDGYWVPRGWSKLGPVKTQSRIDVPRDGARLGTAGPTVIAGVAWAQTRGIQQVEVRHGETEWVQAELSAPLSKDTWVQWRATLDLPEGESFVAVRATDGDGVTQTEERSRVDPDGATGHHTVRVAT